MISVAWVLILLSVLLSGKEANASPMKYIQSLPKVYDGAKGFGGFIDYRKCGDKAECKSWIIKFKDEIVHKSPEKIRSFCAEAGQAIHLKSRRRRIRRFKGNCMRRVKRFGFLKFEATSENQINKIQRIFRNEIEYIERDLEVHALRETDLWGLDRIDQRQLPLNNQYALPANVTGSNVHM